MAAEFATVTYCSSIYDPANVSSIWIFLNVHVSTVKSFKNSNLTISIIAGDLSRAELMMMTIADVIKQLVEAHEEGKDINLNKYESRHTDL